MDQVKYMYTCTHHLWCAVSNFIVVKYTYRVLCVYLHTILYSVPQGTMYKVQQCICNILNGTLNIVASDDVACLVTKDDAKAMQM